MGPLQAAAATIALLAVGCTPMSRSAAGYPSEAMHRGIAYLRTTQAEFGIDVAVIADIVGTLNGDRDALALVQERKPQLRSTDMARFSPLFTLRKPILPESIPRDILPGAHPDLHMRASRNIDHWLAEVLRCRADESSIAFVASNDYWGRVLTHQAAWVLFAHWANCRLAIDLDERRHAVAARLLAEARFDPTYSETFLERLALLGHLGFRRSIDPTWIETLLQEQRADGGWPAERGGTSHPHPTALALWTLAVARPN